MKKKEIVYVLQEMEMEQGAFDLLSTGFWDSIGVAVRDEKQAKKWVEQWKVAQRSYTKIEIVDDLRDLGPGWGQ